MTKYRYILLSILLLTTGFSFSHPKLSLDRKEYLHHDFVTAQLKVYSDSKDATYIGMVFNSNRPVFTVEGQSIVRFRPTDKYYIWEAKWPVPWNAPAGEYEFRIWEPPTQGNIKRNISYRFRISRRTPKPIANDMKILTWENTRPLRSIKMTGPDGNVRDWRGILDWAEYLGANTVWLIGGQTGYFSRRAKREFPWIEDNVGFLKTFGDEAHKRGFKFGVWVACYQTFGKSELKPEWYQWGVDYNPDTNELFYTKAISIFDKQRKNDIIEFLRILENIPEVDMIGLDYIRPPLEGLEMTEQFVEEMQPELPERWAEWSTNKRQKWFGSLLKRYSVKDVKIISQWNWWRAHKIAKLVSEFKQEARITKPLWIFELSWQCGWQHGQDPIMMNDAGADLVAIMLYECNREQFDNLIKPWHSYVNSGEVNIVVGNQFDAVLHANGDVPVTQEYTDRLITAYNKIYADGPALGIFLHDLSRVLWGRKGDYSTMEWAGAGRDAFAIMKPAANKNYTVEGARREY